MHQIHNTFLANRKLPLQWDSTVRDLLGISEVTLENRYTQRGFESFSDLFHECPRHRTKQYTSVHGWGSGLDYTLKEPIVVPHCDRKHSGNYDMHPVAPINYEPINDEPERHQPFQHEPRGVHDRTRDSHHCL